MELYTLPWPETSRSHARNFGAYCNHGAGKPWLGLHPNSRDPGNPLHNVGRGTVLSPCQGAASAPPRDIFEGPPESLRGQRLLQRGSLHGERTGNLLRVVRKMLFVGQASLRRAIGEYIAHYRGERNHQELGNALIRQQPAAGAIDTRVRPRQRV
jgi:hypothetical protein